MRAEDQRKKSRFHSLATLPNTAPVVEELCQTLFPIRALESILFGYELWAALSKSVLRRDHPRKMLSGQYRSTFTSVELLITDYPAADANNSFNGTRISGSEVRNSPSVTACFPAPE